MPCHSSHMEPHEIEIELSRMAYLLDEFETGDAVDPKEFDDGFHPRVYNKDLTGVADALTVELCAKLRARKPEEIARMSPQMREWWRKHQAEDAAREKAERNNVKCPDCGHEFFVIVTALSNGTISFESSPATQKVIQ